jgi:hypothetical protein
MSGSVREESASDGVHRALTGEVLPPAYGNVDVGRVQLAYGTRSPSRIISIDGFTISPIQKSCH